MSSSSISGLYDIPSVITFYNRFRCNVADMGHIPIFNSFPYSKVGNYRITLGIEPSLLRIELLEQVLHSIGHDNS